MWLQNIKCFHQITNIRDKIPHSPRKTIYFMMHRNRLNELCQKMRGKQVNKPDVAIALCAVNCFTFWRYFLHLWINKPSQPTENKIKGRYAREPVEYAICVFFQLYIINIKTKTDLNDRGNTNVIHWRISWTLTGKRSWHTIDYGLPVIVKHTEVEFEILNRLSKVFSPFK